MINNTTISTQVSNFENRVRVLGGAAISLADSLNALNTNQTVYSNDDVKRELINVSAQLRSFNTVTILTLVGDITDYTNTL